MRADVKINGTWMYGRGWLRESIDFPTPQSQTNTVVVPGRNAPIRFTEAFGRVSYQPRNFSITLSMLGSREGFNQMRDELGKGQMVLSCSDGDAYRYHIEETEISMTGGGTLILVNDYMPVIPTVLTTAETALSWNIGEDVFKKSVSAGTWTFPELELQAGQNTVRITGTGTTTFRYREGRL